MTVDIHHGDSRVVLKAVADASIDACVTDPPYALVSIVKRFGAKTAAPAKSDGPSGVYKRASAGFMGQAWDTGETAFDPDFWREVFRVLKPGAHVVAFGAGRGVHHLATAIEAAGFEIRDRVVDIIASDSHVAAFLNSLSVEQQNAFLRCVEESRFGGELAWVFGSGFPKSHNVARSIDAKLGVEGAFGDAKSAAHAGWIERGRMRGAEGEAAGHEGYQRPWMQDGDAVERAAREYLPGSDEGKEWIGWGTALKPALEPIVVARKPLIGTVAENVLAFGVGGLNIDACRIDGAKPATTRGAGGQNGRYGPIEAQGRIEDDGKGRWPAHVLHDGSAEVLSAFPTAPGQMGPISSTAPSPAFKNVYGRMGRQGEASANSANEGGVGFKMTPGARRLDSGSAARFFYSAKADEADRLGSKHPTVKPVDLMAWLCKLVTPPGGLVLDPFAGSGTTGMACLREGFNAVLIEREAEYVADIRRRVAHVDGSDSPLFAGLGA